jgi:hypothetical protein
MLSARANRRGVICHSSVGDFAPYAPLLFRYPRWI